MEQFLTNLSKTVETSILSALTGKLNEFASYVVDLPEIKEKGVTKEQVIECWNSVSDLKINPSNMAVSGVVSTGPAKPRTKTDKNRKCQVPKQRGDNVGQPCGRNCAVGEDVCPTHLSKGSKSNGPTAAIINPNVPSNVPSVEEKKVVVPPPAPVASVPGTEATCQHVMLGGKRPGQPCGVKATKTTAEGHWCTTHGKKH